MPANQDKYAKMLDELAKEYPALADDAAALQAGLTEGDEKAPEDEEEMMFSDEEESAPKAKKIPPELADEEEEDEDSAPLF